MLLYIFIQVDYVIGARMCDVSQCDDDVIFFSLKKIIFPPFILAGFWRRIFQPKKKTIRCC